MAFWDRFRRKKSDPPPEQRALTDAQMVALLQGENATASGLAISPEAALRSTAVFACVRVISETLASLPLILYRRLAPRGKDRAVDHPLYPLLHDRPNPEMTSFTFRETLTSHITLWGNGIAEMQLDGAGRVVALWPLAPNVTRLERDKTGQLWYVTFVPGTGQVGIPSYRIFHVRGLGLTGLWGLSPIGLARQAIGLALATEEYGARFFGNGAQPGVVLKHPGQLKDEAYNRLVKSWDASHTGLSNAHRTAILEEGMGIEKIGIPNDDAQFLETRKFQVRDIARLFRIAPHLVGDLEQATFSNIEQQSLEFVTYTMLPWFARWEQEISRSLLLESERADYFAEFLVDGLLRGDLLSRYQAYAIGRQWGWLSADDVREKENENPLPGGVGTTYLSPLNMETLGQPAPAAAGAMKSSRQLLQEWMQAALRDDGG